MISPARARFAAGVANSGYRSRLALYLARIPAGLTIVVPMVAIVCAASVS